MSVSVPKWGGPRAQKLVAQTLEIKGTVCHLCGLPGANSADHDPPRVDLIRAGVPDPDHPDFLFPAHRRPCNFSRGSRPITPALRAELRAKREAFIATAALSPRFADRARVFESSPGGGRPGGPVSISLGESEKNRRVVVVFGPPGAGKTTYARSLGLRVFDRDDAEWETEAEFTAAAREFCAEPGARAVVIRSGATRAARDRSVRWFAPTETKLMLEPLPVLHRRIRERGRADAAQSHRIVRDWFRRYEESP